VQEYGFIMIHFLKENKMIAKVCMTVCLLLMTAVASADNQLVSKANEESLSFGVVPQQSASRLAEEWGPFLAEVSLRSGVALTFRTAPSIPVFEERLGAAEYDLAYMNPYHYVVFHAAKVSYQAFAKEKGRKIKGIVVVRKDSPYMRLEDLSGKTVVFPAPASFAASILTQAEFGRQKIPVFAKFVASHESAYLNVATGLQEAGCGIQRTFETTPDDVRNVLRIVAETASYTPHAFAAQRRVSKRTVAKVLAAMASLSDDEVGRGILSKLAFKGIVAAEDKDWDDIRALDIRLLQSYSRQ